MAWQPAFTVKLDHLTTVVAPGQAKRFVPHLSVAKAAGVVMSVWSWWKRPPQNIQKNQMMVENNIFCRICFWGALEQQQQHRAVSLYIDGKFGTHSMMKNDDLLHLPAALPIKLPTMSNLRLRTDRCVARWKNVSGVWTTTRFGMAWRLGGTRGISVRKGWRLEWKVTSV